MIQVEQHPHGVILPVRAAPGSRNNELRGEQDGALKVSVTAVAEKGKANKAIVALLSKSLGLRKSQIELIRGTTSSNKWFLIQDVSPKDLEHRLSASSRLSP